MRVTTRHTAAFLAALLLVIAAILGTQERPRAQEHPARIISVCSTASWVGTSTSPLAAAITAGLPPS